MKICTKCGVEKPIERFARNGKNGIHSACKDCAKARAKELRASNLEHYREKDAERYARDRDNRRAANKEYCARTADRRSELERKRYAAESEKIKARNAQYRAENKSKVFAWNGKRRARCDLATPAWADISAIASKYAEAKRLTEQTGVVHHVDHFIPLLGKTASGLHVEANLQVITAAENLKKGASVSP